MHAMCSIAVICTWKICEYVHESFVDAMFGFEPLGYYLCYFSHFRLAVCDARKSIASGQRKPKIAENVFIMEAEKKIGC